MPEQNFATESKIIFHRFWKLRMNDAIINHLLVGLELALKDSRKRVALNRALARHVGCTWPHTELDAANSSTVLPSVMLFFHQQKQLIEAIQWRIIFFLEVGQRLQKADHRDTAFVLQKIAHGGKRQSLQVTNAEDIMY